jgi:diguanylate cyclase (GGDEF)-like protein/PAS domain S-box-containing protein
MDIYKDMPFNHSEEALHTIKAHFAGVLDIAYDAIISIDESRQITIFNKRAEQIFGYSQEEIIGQPLDCLIPERFRSNCLNPIDVFSGSAVTAGQIGERSAIYGRRKNGDEFPAEASISKIKLENENLYTVVLRDITNEKRWEHTLYKHSICDTLTGLYNRRYFDLRIEEDIARADRNKEMLAILLCDLDRFKFVNDTLGHQVGDQILKNVTKSIQESTRGSDSVFRWGGDEIVVILGKTSRHGILITSERIREGIRKISEVAGLDLDISIGVAVYPEHGKKVDQLIRLADRALYIAKRGGDKIHIGEEEYRLDDDSIETIFQPIVDLKLNQVMGYEALSRDPQGKLSVPQLFKKYDAIGQLNELKQLCFKLQLKKAAELKLPRLFINTDFNTIKRLEVVPKPPGMKVILEISELEALHDIEGNLKVAKNWKLKGYHFAIDDFGAGFISLPFVASLVPEYIKVDRSTMVKAVSSEKFRKFLKHLLQSLKVYSREGIIAEGIETEKELKVVKQLRIDFVQGFLFGKSQKMPGFQTAWIFMDSHLSSGV